MRDDELSELDFDLESLAGLDAGDAQIVASAGPRRSSLGQSVNG